MNYILVTIYVLLCLSGVCLIENSVKDKDI